MLLDVAADAAADGGEALLFGDVHVQQLLASSQQCRQSLGIGIGQRPGLRSDGLGEVGQTGRIQGIGLG